MSLIGDGPKQNNNINNNIVDNPDLAWSFIQKLFDSKKGQARSKYEILIPFLEGEGWSQFEDLGGEFKLSLFNRRMQICEKLKESAYITGLENKTIVSFGGKFSSGKSAVINSIINDEILPEGQSPVTSVPTYVMNGPSDKRFVLTNNHDLVEFEQADVEALTHEFKDEYDVDCSLLLERMILGSTAWHYSNLAILDTPGYTKPDGGKDSEKARVQLCAADYIIWVVAADNGDLAGSDIKFLKGLKTTHPIFFLINKADLKSGKEVQEIVEQIEKTIKKAGISYHACIAYTANCWYEKGGDDVRDKLLDTGKQKLEEYLDDLQSNSKEEHKSIDGEISELLNCYEGELEKKRQQLEKEQSDLERGFAKILYPKNCRTILNLYKYYGQQLYVVDVCATFLKEQRQKIAGELRSISESSGKV